MKLAKLSLAAIVVAGLATSSFAADTLADAFKNGKVNGAVQAYYWMQDKGAADADIFTTGIDLSYATASFNGFAFKATFQSSAAPFADKDAKTGAASFADDMWGSGAVLSEAYVSYTMKNTTALVGRMYLDTPLVASSGGRMTKEAFEGAAVINTDLPNATLIAGYVQKFQARTDNDGNIGEFSKTFGTGSGYPVAGTVDLKDGAYTVAAINKSITGLTLTGAFADAIDVIQIYYAEAAYEGKASNFTYGLAAQYYFNDFDSGANTNLFGVKATIGVGDFTFLAAYSKADDEKDVVTGLGGGADLAFTGSPILADSYAADTDAYKVGVSYAINKNANIGLTYVVDKIDSAAANADKFTYAAIEADYSFEGALKGLGVAAAFEDQGGDGDKKEFRLNVNYKF